jgi:Rod binding domain-containing protein
VRHQAEELEGVFLGTLTKQMFASIKTDGDSFGGGFGEETWRSMQAEQLGRQPWPGNGGLGIADQIMGDLLNAAGWQPRTSPSLPNPVHTAQYGASAQMTAAARLAALDTLPAAELCARAETALTALVDVMNQETTSAARRPYAAGVPAF